MRPGRIHKATWGLIRYLQWATLVLLFAVLIVQVIPTFGLTSIKLLQVDYSEQTKLFGAAMAALVGLLGVLRKYIGEPWLWKCVKRILAGFQESIFSELDSSETRDHHRVTLYRFDRWNWWPKSDGKWHWPWVGWLVPLVRAGPEKPASTVFLAVRSEQRHGVCGAAFFRQAGAITLESLPCVDNSSSEEEVEEYARQTFISADMVRRRIAAGKPCARSFHALSVKVDGIMWGVVMIDSLAETLPQPQVTQHKFIQIQGVLQQLLRRT